MRRHEFNPWVGKIPWRRKWQLTPVFLPGKSHGERSLAGYRPWGLKDEDTTWQLNNKVVSTAAVMQILKSKLQVLTKVKGTQLPLHTKPDRLVLDHLVLKSGQPFSHSPAICSSHWLQGPLTDCRLCWSPWKPHLALLPSPVPHSFCGQQLLRTLCSSINTVTIPTQFHLRK